MVAFPALSVRPSVRLSRRWPADVETALAARYEVQLNLADRPMDPAGFRDAMTRFDVVCPTVTDRLGEAELSAPGRRVRLIANYGAGVDHIDLDAARRLGVQVSNTPDVLTDATADLALLLILMAARRAGEGERELRRGDWTGWRPTHLLGQGLAGKQLGLVGFGRIGQATARRARALGMRIAYYSRRRAAPVVETELAAIHHPTLESLVSSSDVVSLHCPGGAETRHLIDAGALALMKSTAILVNTSRGSVVNERDLASALSAGVIAGAGLDVFEAEPGVEPALLAHENAVLLPHLGSATLDARTAMGLRVVANIDGFFESGEVIDRVA